MTGINGHAHTKPVSYTHLQIYPAWNKDTEIWLKEAVGKLKNIADEKERER